MRFYLRSLIIILLAAAGLTTPAHADEPDVQRFTFLNWDVTYHLHIGDDGRADAEVTETLTAQFPQTDQNRGLVRSLPTRYHSAPAKPSHIQVTDETGNPIPFSLQDQDGMRTISIGDDTYVHGEHTYVITYTVDDVIHTTETADEFYWDLVPVDRRQHINQVTATIHLDETLTSALTGNAACYRGTPEKTQACTLHHSDDGVFEMTETDLIHGRGLTAAIGFTPGTVVQPPQRQPDALLDIGPIVVIGIALLISGAGVLAIYRMIRRHQENTAGQTIQYGIPTDLHPALAKWLINGTQHHVVAQLLDLAVRGVIHIETPTGNHTKPVLRLIAPTLLTDPVEQRFVNEIFSHQGPGATFDFPKNSKAFRTATQHLLPDSGKAVLERGYQRKLRHRGAVIAGWTALGLILPAVVLLIMGISRDNTVTQVITIIGILLTALFAVLCLLPHRVHTPRGAALRTQLDWVRDMVRGSEADRLAQHRPTDHNTDVIQLYDRLLPYAVLFGAQKDWTQVLALEYERHNWPVPVWYPAMMHHPAGLQESLNTMINSVSSAATTSSPQTGSTGAGMAGGGGGGGAVGGR